MKPAYYNEYEKYAAQWLRNLIAAGHIAPGDVDERSIEDVRPDDLRGYTQCHFFAGIGVWSYALRRAGWPDDRPVWTGSCPCQPFSTAGKGLAFADERHLWPAWLHLIRQRRPTALLGEQVASTAVDDWIDLVQTDLEALGYCFGSIPFPSASVGAPHIRDRNYWAGVAQGDTGSKGLGKRGRFARVPGRTRGADQREAAIRAGIHPVRLEYAPGIGRAWSGDQPEHVQSGQADQAIPRLRLADNHGAGLGEGGEGFQAMGHRAAAESNCGLGGMADDELQQRQSGQSGIGAVNAAPGWEQSAAAIAGFRGDMRPGPVNGFWSDADWIGCRDGKFRPVEPGTFPLADGITNRVGRLRAYGNAINAEQAKVWIETVMECMP